MAGSNFEAVVDDRTIRLTMEESRVTIDGNTQPYSLKRIGSNTYSLILGGRSAAVVIEPIDSERFRVTVDGYSRIVRLKDEQDLLLEEMGLEEIAASSEAEILAPMPRLVLAVHVEPGQTVRRDDKLAVVEAMKMENELRAPAEGRITAVHVSAGETVDKDQLLIEVEPTG